jgi:NTP pyrophosphatase (non-canonical NTP hydrolase)
MTTVDLSKYSEFVTAVTSAESLDTEKLIKRMREMEASGINVARLMTGCAGLAAEAGEFNEIPKKMLFQGKPVNDDEIFHMKRELGDIVWYWIQACLALGADPHEIIAMNVDKLKKRYPGGQFDVTQSENRKAGDI